jgi:NTP pyrophosphatase (non-canonical NTP hydrolase)
MDLKKLTHEVEKVSKIYSSKFNIDRDSDWFVLKLQEELGELIQSYLMLIGKAKLKGKNSDEIKLEFENEVGDVFCHVLLLANYFNVDLEKIVERKWLKWNK